MPPSKPFIYSSLNDPYSLKNLDINFTVQNIDNLAFDLMRETERLEFDISIKNKYQKNVTLYLSDTTYVLGEYTAPRKSSHMIRPTEQIDFSTVVYLNKAGINTVYLNFELHEYEDPERAITGGIQKSSLIESGSISYAKKVYTQSEYDFRAAQYHTYY